MSAAMASAMGASVEGLGLDMQEAGGSSVLDPRAEFAASIEARGGLTSAEVARAAGVTHARLRELRQTPHYRSFVRRVLSDAAAESRAAAVATRAGRLSLLQARHDLLVQVVEQRGAAADPRYHDPSDEALRAAGWEPAAARAAFPSLGELYDPTNPACAMCRLEDALTPGASTGLLARVERVLGTGLAARTVVEHQLDAGLLAAMASTEKQAAQESGQWDDGGATIVQKLYVSVDMDRV